MRAVRRGVLALVCAVALGLGGISALAPAPAGTAAASPLLEDTPAEEADPAEERPREAVEPDGDPPSDGMPAPGRPEAAEEGSRSLAQQVLGWVIAQQRSLHRALAEGIETLREAPSLTAAVTLITISFLYGVFHAVGPGHGKAVITTYLLTHRQDLRRGIGMSFSAALVQGLSAIAAVSAVLFIAGRTARDALGQTALLEQVSFGLVTLLGVWLTSRPLRALWRRWRDRHHAPGAAGSGGALTDTACCGGDAHHHIDPQQAAPSDGWWPVVGTVAAVGARPCAGAILVLVVAQLMEIWYAGVLAVLAMSVGTGITVATLATLAVVARQRVARYAAPTSRPVQIAGHALTLCGGLLILAIGATLLIGSVTLANTPHPVTPY